MKSLKNVLGKKIVVYYREEHRAFYDEKVTQSAICSDCALSHAQCYLYPRRLR